MVHLPLVAHIPYVTMHYKNSGLRLSLSTVMSMQANNSFKRIISSPNFVAIALLVGLARKDPGTTSPFSSLLYPDILTCTLFSWRALRNVNIRKEFIISFNVSPNCVFFGTLDSLRSSFPASFLYARDSIKIGDHAAL